MKYILLVFGVVMGLYSGMLDLNETEQNALDAEKSVRTTREYTPADENVDISKSDNQELATKPDQWRLYFKKQSPMKYDEKSVGNIELLMKNGSLGEMYKNAIDKPVDQLTSKKILENDALRNNQAIEGYKDFVDGVKSNLFVNSITSLGSIKQKEDIEKRCSIKRDLNVPLGYKCYYADGSQGEIFFSPNKTLQEQLAECNAACMKTEPCSMVQEGKKNLLSFPGFLVKAGRQSFTFNVDASQVYQVKFDVNETKDVFATLHLYTASGENITVYNHLPLRFSDTSTITLDANIDDVTVVELVLESDSDFKVGKVEILALKERPLYSCPISGHVGDSEEGYYTSKAQCESECVSRGKCKMEFESEFVSLYSGAIVNECAQVVSKYENCRLKDEYVDYYGNGKFVKTVENFAAVPGVVRPRIYASSDDNLTKRVIEETKDNAYRNMSEMKTYDVVVDPFTKDTNVSYAYRTVLRTSDKVGLYGGEPIGLDLLIKPRRLDVRNGVRYRVYGVLEVEVDYKDFSLGYYVRDKIWYMLKSPKEAFPFKRLVRYARIALDNYLPGYDDVIEDQNLLEPQLIPISTAREQDETFLLNADGTGNWVPLSSQDCSSYYLWEGEFKGNSYVWVVNYIDVLDNFLAPTNSSAIALPGIYRRIDSQLRKIYTGKSDGTGQAIVKLKAYAYYQKATDPLDYKKLFENMVPFWESGNENSYPREPGDDSYLKDDGIKIYVNGPTNKTSIYTVIKVRPEYVGKPGFIFVFLGD